MEFQADGVNQATEATVDFIVGAKLGSFPAAVIREGKRCLIDGCALHRPWPLDSCLQCNPPLAQLAARH